jgi:hypothetical protein
LEEAIMENVVGIVGRPPEPKRSLRIPIGGAHRGAERGLAAIQDHNSKSTITVVPVGIDPMPGRALALQQIAARRGIVAEAIEGRVEDALATKEFEPHAPVVLHLDRASSIAKTLASKAAESRTVLGYLLIVLPSNRMWALRFALEANDLLARKAAVTFFQTLGEMTERGSSNSVLGDGADPSHILAEDSIRDWFAAHGSANLSKAIAGVEPVSSTFEVTSDGKATRPLFIAITDAWSDARTLAKQAMTSPSSSPLKRGTEFAVAEVVPGRDGGIRFHSVRRRRDGRISVQGAADILDRATVEEQERARAAADAAEAKARSEAEDAARRAAAQAETSPAHITAPPSAGLLPPRVATIERPDPGSAAMARLLELTVTALSRAERETVSRSNPVRTTD